MNLQNIFGTKKEKINTPPAFSGGRNYLRAWKTMVCFFAIGLVLLSFFSWQIYLSSKIGGGYLSPESVPSGAIVKNVDKKRLQNDILIVETKQVEYLKLKADNQKVADPSM